MIGMYAIAAFALMLLGGIAAAMVLFAIGINNEERRRSIHRPNPGLSALGLRAILHAQVHPRAQRDLAFHGPRPGRR